MLPGVDGAIEDKEFTHTNSSEPLPRNLQTSAN